MLKDIQVCMCTPKFPFLRHPLLPPSKLYITYDRPPLVVLLVILEVGHSQVSNTISIVISHVGSTSAHMYSRVDCFLRFMTTRLFLILPISTCLFAYS